MKKVPNTADPYIRDEEAVAVRSLQQMFLDKDFSRYGTTCWN